MGRVTIVGLGLIGGSIGLALRRAQPVNTDIIGYDKNPEVMERAHRAGVVQGTAPTLARAVQDSTMVIVASPIVSMRKVFQEMAPHLRQGCVVTDTASTKSDVLGWARETLPDNVYFVGGHPMAGKETTGIEEAEADLFRDKPWVITPSVDATEQAVATVVALAQTVGATPMFMDADEHDSYVAAISHLPLTMAAALFSVALTSAAWPELAGLASSGFRDTTRLASGSPELAHDIVMTNRENVLHWIDRMQSELFRFREAIASGDSERIVEAFTKAQLERDRLMLEGPPPREKPEKIETVSLGDMLMGTRIKEFMKKQEELIREQEQRANRK
jgi:prephenate dehydrogenase